MYAVAAAHPKAVEAGMRVLAEGGDACDAAVAVAITLGVAEPFMSGIGGGGSCLLWRAREGKAEYLYFHNRCPRHAQPGMFPCDEEGRPLTRDNEQGHLSVLVPGLLRGLEAFHGRYGRLPWAPLFEEAIALAEGENPVNSFYRLQQSLPRFGEIAALFPELRRIHSDEGKPFAEGHPLRQAEYGATLRRIAKEGPGPFYEGEIAEAIAEEMKRGGGIVDARDLAEYRAKWIEPYRGSYRGRNYFVASLPTSGLVMLQGLNMLECALPRWEAAEGPAQRVAYARGMRSAWRDRFRFYGDPDWVEVPLGRLMSKEYAAESIRNESAAEMHAHNRALGSTSHFCVIDGEGNAVSQTQTLGAAFGSGVVVPGTGIVLNNSNWKVDPRPGRPNSPAPRKFPLSNSAATLLFEGERLRLVAGSPGSYRIPGAVAQTLINRLDRGLELQDAVSAPRMHIDAGPLEVEGAIEPEASKALQEAGFALEFRSYPDHYFGGVHALEVREDGSLTGAADPRRSGTWRAEG